MNSQLALVSPEDNGDIILREMQNTQKLCGALMKTPHYAKLGPEGIYAIVSKAKSLNMDPIYALNGGLYFLKGKVGMTAEAMAARMRQAGHSIIKDLKSTSTCCILHGKRGDNGDTWTVSFSIEDAKRAGIYQEAGAWGKYGEDMCYNRCVSRLFRQMTPDLSLGTGYTPDEIQEIVSQDNHKKVSVSTIDVNTNTGEIIEEKNEITLSKISQDQVFEIEDIMHDCSEDYKEKIKEFLFKQGFEGKFCNLSPSAFENLKAKALIRRDEHQSSKKKDVNISHVKPMEMQVSLFPEEVK